MVTQNYRCVQNHETLKTHTSNCNGDVTMLEYVFINLNLQSYMWVQEIQSNKFNHVHQIMKNGLFHGLTAPSLMEMSQYFTYPYNFQSLLHPTVPLS